MAIPKVAGLLIASVLMAACATAEAPPETDGPAGIRREPCGGGPVFPPEEQTPADRASGSSGPHAELKDSNGQRVNLAGEAVIRTSPENHTPIIDDRD